MPVQTRSMIKREMQKQQTQQQEQQTQQQEQQTQQQTQEERLTEEYNKIKYIKEFNISELDMTQQYMQSVPCENKKMLKNLIQKCASELLYFDNKEILYNRFVDLHINIIITIFKYIEGLFILNSITSDGVINASYKKLLITSFDKIKQYKNSHNKYTPVQQKKLNDALDNFMFNIVNYI